MTLVSAKNDDAPNNGNASRKCPTKNILSKQTISQLGAQFYTKSLLYFRHFFELL